MEGYTARDALILMRLDLTESLHELDRELSELNETLEFSGIAEQMLRDDPSLTDFPAIKQWLEIVSNRNALLSDKQELAAERDEVVSALAHLRERLAGK